MNVGSVPALRAVTRPLTEVPADLLAYADPHQPLVWTRGDRGCVGIGEVLRLSFRGATRFEDATRMWREITQAAEIDDPVGLPGTGLLAFGTFTFRGDASGVGATSGGDPGDSWGGGASNGADDSANSSASGSGNASGDPSDDANNSASGSGSGCSSVSTSRSASDDANGNASDSVNSGAGETASGSERPESVLVVPRILIARHRGTAWITEIREITEISEVDSADQADPDSLGRGQPIAARLAESGVADADTMDSGAAESAVDLPESKPLGDWAGAQLDTESSDPAYLEGVREATARIENPSSAEFQSAGDGSSLEKAIGKIVLARQVRGRIDAADDLRVPLKRLAERYEDCWTYAVDGMIGASPETLVRQTDGAISARVLAGTRGRCRDDPAADDRARDELLTSSKEQHEHSFAVQSVVTALTPHVRELHTSEEPFALRLPNVWHLATDLGAVPGDGGTSLELTAALHPTAAVAGTPTSAAVQAIAELEPFDRGRYAGPVGWIDAKGEGEWVIALRCAFVGPAKVETDPECSAHAAITQEAGLTGEKVKPVEPGQETRLFREVTAYAGGGIVAGSDPDHEFNETVSKFAPIAEAFSA